MKSNLRPVQYKLEEYEPPGMAGIIVFADLAIGISDGDVYVDEIYFPDQPDKTSLIPSAFIKALILSIHSDDKIMDWLRDAAHRQYEMEMEGF
mgnify:CR=1 FL=1